MPNIEEVTVPIEVTTEVTTKVDWKKKLSSRKLWVSVGGFITMMILAFDGPSGVAPIIAGAGIIIAYVFGESLADAFAKGSDMAQQIVEVMNGDEQKPEE